MGDVVAVSLRMDGGGSSSVVSISGTSAQSAVLNTFTVLISPTVDCFVREGTNPTALADGTDMLLFGGNSYRVVLQATGHKLAFITSSATGSVYITPGA